MRLGPAALADLLRDTAADELDRSLAAEELASHGEAAAPSATEAWMRNTEDLIGSSAA